MNNNSSITSRIYQLSPSLRACRAATWCVRLPLALLPHQFSAPCSECPQTSSTLPPVAQGSGVFYAGYVLFQIPSNLLLSRLGAKLWLPLITAAFGAVAVCSALFIRGPGSFYALRLALGITEAGGLLRCKGLVRIWRVRGQWQ
jgi:MFS family permease